MANVTKTTMQFGFTGSIRWLSGLRGKNPDKYFPIIIQQIVTMPIYGKEALNICHPT